MRDRSPQAAPPSTHPLRSELLRRQPVGRPSTGPQLDRSIGTFQLTMFGVGATIGTGIFFVLSAAVPEAGPAVIISFIKAGVAAGLAALCYAEMASSVPVSGSTYSYAYATLGEIVAMGVDACLLLEYGVSTAAVAVGWSGYLNEAFRNIAGVALPHVILAAPWDSDPGVINLPAVVLRGYRSVAADGVSRVTCAFSDSHSSVRVVTRIAELSQRLGVPARVASFGVRGHTIYPPEVGLTAEDSVLDSWSAQAAQAQQRLVDEGLISATVERVIATGGGWSDSVASIDWRPGELLALGSSTVAPLAPVFLGSRAAKLVRHSPVPMVVVPS